MDHTYLFFGFTALAILGFWTWIFNQKRWTNWFFGITSTMYMLFVAYLVPFMATNMDNNLNILLQLIFRSAGRT